MTARGSQPVVAFAGGGTGGHLCPGLAVARWLRESHPHVRLIFFVTGRPLERRLLGTGEFEVVGLAARASPGSWWGWPLTGASQAAAVVRSLGEVRRLKVGVLVALGGYGSVAPGVAAWSLGRPLVALEQNSVPGRATRFLSLLADVVCLAWPETKARLWRRGPAVTTGNPLRAEVLTGDARRAAQQAGLREDSPVLLVLGGSQGSSAINRWVTEALPRLRRKLPGLQVVHQTGERDHSWVGKGYRRAGLPSHVTPFLENIGDFYRLATLAVARAGATTLSELAAAGLPAILVPYPFATDDHQRVNARLLADRGAAVLVEEAQFDRVDLVVLVQELLEDESRRREMVRALESVARREAVRLVGRCIETLLWHPEARGAARMVGS